MAEHEEQQRVTYTVKEVLARIEAKIDTALTQLATKADAAQVDRLEKRVSDLEARNTFNQEAAKPYLEEWREIKADVKILKAGANVDDAIKRNRRWLIATSIAAVAAVAALVAVALKVHISLAP